MLWLGWCTTLMAFWYSLIELKITFSLSDCEETCITDEIPYLSQTLVGRGGEGWWEGGRGETAAAVPRVASV